MLEDPTIIPFDWLSIAFRLSYDVDEGWETQEVQAVLMSLIIQVGPSLSYRVHLRSCLLILIRLVGIYQRHDLGR